jgi:thymidylate kinase
MKLLIIEGLDRCGKDTLIKNLIATRSNYAVRHWDKPKGNTDEEKREFQEQFFEKEFSIASNLMFLDDNPNNLLIWNRAHLGEFVYGKLYRDTKPEEWVMDLETKFEFVENPTVYMVLLVAPAKFLCDRDDGESFASDIESKVREKEAFFKAYSNSKISNKLLIDVTDGHGQYRSMSTITDEVNKFLSI